MPFFVSDIIDTSGYSDIIFSLGRDSFPMCNSVQSFLVANKSSVKQLFSHSLPPSFERVVYID